jgi:hypothetical protein
MITFSPVGTPCGMHQVLSTTKVKQLITLTGDGMGKPHFFA